VEKDARAPADTKSVIAVHLDAFEITNTDRGALEHHIPNGALV
jgi:hypothetical protein